jgi:hypothetical protein
MGAVKEEMEKTETDDLTLTDTIGRETNEKARARDRQLSQRGRCHRH